MEVIVTKDGVELRTARWQPTDNLNQYGEPRGTICLFQGRAECIEKYYDVIEDLRKRGFVVATLDWRGQGLSQRLLKKARRGHIRHFNEYRRDLEAFITQIASVHCPPPYFALAHSMGGHILFSEANKGASGFFERMVLSAPMLHLSPRMLFGPHWFYPGKRAVNYKIVKQRWTRMITGFMRFFGLGRFYAPGGGSEIIYAFAGNLQTSDEARFDKMNEMLTAHPELGIGSPTIAWVNAACFSMRRVLRPGFLSKVSVPTLIVAAGSDQIVSTPLIEKVVPTLRVVHHVVLLNARHEIMMERDDIRDQFWAAFDAFIPGSSIETIS